MVTYSRDNPGQRLTTFVEHNGQYGAFPPRIALTCDVGLDVATEIFNAYWEVNRSIKQVSEAQVWKEVDGQKWLLNPINGYWYFLKNIKDIFSTLIQGTASFVFDLWLNFVLAKYKNLLAQFHDEFIMEILASETDDAKTFVNECIDKVNSVLNLDREMACDIQFGSRYSDIH